MQVGRTMYACRQGSFNGFSSRKKTFVWVQNGSSSSSAHLARKKELLFPQFAKKALLPLRTGIDGKYNLHTVKSYTIAGVYINPPSTFRILSMCFTLYFPIK